MVEVPATSGSSDRTVTAFGLTQRLLVEPWVPPMNRPTPHQLQRKHDGTARLPNGRPRETLGWMTPSQLLANAVAMTG